jgi:hypothetical protein
MGRHWLPVKGGMRIPAAGAAAASLRRPKGTDGGGGGPEGRCGTRSHGGVYQRHGQLRSAQTPVHADVLERLLPR